MAVETDLRIAVRHYHDMTQASDGDALARSSGPTG
jgi:hypothetical protein